MAFSAQYGTFNVQASLNDWFTTNITANGIPAWMPSARVVFDWGNERPLINGHSGHAFSVTHLDSNPGENYQGRHVDGGQIGHRQNGLMEVNCWVDKSQGGGAYMARLREMSDMVLRLCANAVDTPILDFYASTAAPSSMTALVHFDEAQVLPVGPDTNPDIMRARHVIPYWWVMRA